MYLNNEIYIYLIQLYYGKIQYINNLSTVSILRKNDCN